MLRLLSALLFSIAATMANARCEGVDLRPHLSSETRARLEREAAKVPFAYGNHWIATKGSQNIHVVGTLHIGDKRMRSTMRKLKPIIKSADLVFLERTTSQMAEVGSPIKAFPKLFLMPQGRSLQTMMSQKDWEQLNFKLAFERASPEQMARLQPWAVSYIMLGSRCGGLGLTSFKGLDSRIEAIAKHARVPLSGLEENGIGYRAMSRQPMKDQMRLLKLGLSSRKGFDDHRMTIFGAYFDEAVTEAQILGNWTLFDDMDVSRAEVTRLRRQVDAQLLDWRNQLWMPVILKRQEKNLFIAVGAAHLPGRNGILQLLKNKGYTLTRAAF